MSQPDTVVVITGASSGIGAASAQALVESGAKVVLGARREERLKEFVEIFGEDQALAVPMDVRRPEDSRRLIAAALERFGHLSAVVAAAGIGMYGGILDNTDEECAEMMDTNYAGTVWTVRAAVPALLANGGGDIVIIASVAGLRGGANEAIYAGTKHAQVGLAGSLDRELREKAIRVATICPAAVHTEFAIGKGRTEGDPWLESVLHPKDVAQAVLTVLAQPRHLRTTQWEMWSMAQSS